MQKIHITMWAQQHPYHFLVLLNKAEQIDKNRGCFLNHVLLCMPLQNVVQGMEQVILNAFQHVIDVLIIQIEGSSVHVCQVSQFLDRLLALTMTLCCCSALAENTKHERVYVVTKPDGTVENITDNVRLENADGLDELIDRTMLTNIENLGGQETFALDGETLVWQAKGNDISYQGTSEKIPTVLPIVHLMLDGKEISAEELKDKTGDVRMTVSYQVTESLPVLAVTVLPLPETGITDLKLENATILSEMGRQVLVGWAVPGMDEKLELPASFTAAFHADHAELSWMMTLTTADPIDVACRELDERIDLDAHLELDEATALLTALRDGTVLPETTGKTKDIVPKITELNDGLTQLDDGAAELATGAATLADGAATLKSGADQVNEGAASLATGTDLLSTNLVTAADGAASLDTGLAALIENNEALNAGATQLFTAVLQTVNQQLADSGLAEAGMTIPELTAENYAEVLDTVIAQLDPDALKASAAAQVEAVIRPQVEANTEAIRAAVTEAAQGKVLEAVLQAAQVELSAEQYQAAVQGGMIPKEQAAQIDTAVQAQLESDEIQAQIDAAVQEQIETLVQQHVTEYLETDESVAAQLQQAQAAHDSLVALKAQLDQVNTFVTGLKAYTDGAAQAATGAAALNTGLAQLSEGAVTLNTGAAQLAEGASTLATGADTLATGAADLSTGADTLHTTGTTVMKNTILDAEKNSAEKLLPYVENDLADALRIFEKTRDAAGQGGYDLRPEGMKTVTVYIIRTDF